MNGGIYLPKISTQLHMVADEMCKNYCRFPLVYTPETFSDKDYMDRLLQEKCKTCPLRKLV